MTRNSLVMQDGRLVQANRATRRALRLRRATDDEVNEAVERMKKPANRPPRGLTMHEALDGAASEMPSQDV